jgi:hypothetical protein
MQIQCGSEFGSETLLLSINKKLKKNSTVPLSRENLPVHSTWSKNRYPIPVHAYGITIVRPAGAASFCYSPSKAHLVFDFEFIAI